MSLQALSYHWWNCADNFRTVYIAMQNMSPGKSLWKFKQYSPSKCACFRINTFKVCWSHNRPTTIFGAIKYTLAEINQHPQLLGKGYKFIWKTGFPVLFLQMQARKTKACRTMCTFSKTKTKKTFQQTFSMQNCAAPLTVALWRWFVDTRRMFVVHYAFCRYI